MYSKRIPALLLTGALLLLLLAGCGAAAEKTAETGTDTAEYFVDYWEFPGVDIAEEAVALAELPALGVDLVPVASGTSTQTNDCASIDYSNTADGYVMAKYTASTSKKLKVQVKGPATTYTYNITAGADWTTFPLSDGNGSYKVTVYQNTSGTKYSTVLSASFGVSMRDEFAPFLRPNQYVNYTNAVNTKAKAAVLCKGLSDPLEKVKAVYEYAVATLKYDKAKAASVKSGYLPDLDAVLAAKKGICFDYAALMTAMLRSQGVPCKLVVGYAGKAYHAWISVYSEEDGWITAAIYFDGSTWQRMDPTFASSAKQSASIMKYIGNGKNYTAKYFY